MVLPLLAAGIGAAGSIGSGLLGMSAANRADDTNWQIALLNYYQRERERNDRIAQAQKVDRENKLGQTDADGGTVKFVPGVGWVQTRGQQQQIIANAQNAEQQRILEQDLPTKRAVQQRNVARGLEDSADADAIRREMRTMRKGSDDELEALLYGAATRGMDEAFDASTATATREAARTGSTNTPKLLAGLAEQRAKSQADAAMEARLRARGSGQQEFDTRRAGLANLYNLFATRASVAPDVSFQPMPVDANGQKVAAALSKQGVEAGNAVTNAFGAKGGSMDYVQPNYGGANALATASNALAGLFRNPTLWGDSSGGMSSYNKTQYRAGENGW